MRATFTISGVPELVESLRRYGEQVEESSRRITLEIAKKAATIAKTLAPVEPEDGGQLRDSIRAALRKPQPGQVEAVVLAGGQPLEAFLQAHGHKFEAYAIVQHEDSTLKHTVGGPKFVERALYQVAPGYLDQVQAALPSELP
jgi:hypothetical protein